MNMYVILSIHVHIEVCIKVGSKKISYTMMHGRKNIKSKHQNNFICAHKKHMTKYFTVKALLNKEQWEKVKEWSTTLSPFQF